MTINIQDLLKELVSYTVIRTSNISSEAKSVLVYLRREFKSLEDSNDPNKQAKMIALFIGGTIYALKQDDWKYNYSFKLYPETLTNEVFVNVQNNSSAIEAMYSVGKQALLNLPKTFNGNIFKVEGKLINTSEPLPFLPQLKEHADKIDLLVNFCIKYAENLNQVEVDEHELGLIDLEVSDDSKLTDELIESKKQEMHESHSHGTSTTSFSNTSMQVLGGFIASIGIAAVAVAFVALNAATFGLAGLIVAGVGAAAILGGIGLFAAGTYRKHQSTPDLLMDDALASVSM